MSKEYKNIDDLYKAELGGSAPKAPAHVKANVDKALGFGSSKKLLWILLPILILLVASPFIYNSFQSEDLAQNSSSDTIAQNETNNSANNSSSNTVNQNNESTTENNQYTSDQIQKDNTNGMNQTNSSDNNGNDLNINSSNSQFQTNTSSTFSGEQKNKKKSDNKITTSSNINKTTSTLTNKEPIDNGDVKNKVNTDNIISTDSKNNSIITDNKTNQKNNSSTNKTLDKDSIQNTKVKAPIKDDQIVENNLDTDTTITQNKDVANQINTDSLVDNTIDTTAQNNNDLIVEDNKSTDTTNTNNNVNIDPPTDPYQPWLLSLSTGVNFKNSKITAANPSDSAAYNNTINDRIGHSASFDAQYRLKNSLTFGAGIGYSTLIENFNYYKSEITTDSALTYVYFQDSIPDSMGWIYFTDSTAEYTYTTDSNEIYNANGRNINTYLHIPISLGTQLRFNKVFIDLFAQGRFNLLLISKATYVENDQLVTTNLTTIKRSYFDLVLGTNVHYNIVGNLFLTGTVRYRPPLNNPYYVNGMTNRFSNLHLGIGVSLNL